MRDLHRNDRGKEVSDVQVRLRANGFDLGNEGIDGYFGPHTEVAVRAFQQGRGLLVDGVVGANTWRELVETGYRLGDRLLYLKMPYLRGDDVLELQVKLNLLGFNAGAERGIHDDEVERAVLDFQRNTGLPVDGIVGERVIATLDALRKAESGREGKKIPDRDGGYVAVRPLAGLTVVIDPGHGGRDPGHTTTAGVSEKQLTLHLGLRLAEVLRAEGCAVTTTRDGDETVDVYERTECALAAAPDYVLSLHANGLDAVAAAGAACYYFQRQHYYCERGKRLADHIGARLEEALEVRYLGGFGRNYAILREVRATCVLVEPLHLTNPVEADLARRPDFVERTAHAIADGLADYLARAPLAAPAQTTGTS